MSSEYTPSRGRRSNRRSGRPNRSKSGSTRSRHEAPAEPKKKTLWQKITSFFGGKPASEPKRPVRQAGRPAEESAPKPKRDERPSGFRKPEIVEVNSPRVYVGNLSFDATESDLLDLFNGVGQVQNVEVISNKYTQKSKGFGFVQMQTVDEAKRAVAELHDKEYMGRKLVVSGAKAVDEKRSERSRQPEPEQQAEQQPAASAQTQSGE